jgi:hypothetical protein
MEVEKMNDLIYALITIGIFAGCWAALYGFERVK